MSTPNGTPSKRARNENAGPQTPQQNDPITPSRRTRAGSQQTPSRTPSRSRKCSFSSIFKMEKMLIALETTVYTNELCIILIKEFYDFNRNAAARIGDANAYWW